MKSENTDKIRKRILALIESEYESDAAFERALEIPDKTVNNWRRGRSASFMRMLPKISELFRVSVTELMDIPVSKSISELSDDEIRLVELYRRSRPLPEKMRGALAETIEKTIELYLAAYAEMRRNERKRPGRKPTEGK